MTWVRPGDEPRWGHAGGLQIGLAPLPGPRGLIRVYAPYLGLDLLNFIAVEPTPAGATERGYSELERSVLDDVPGLRFWGADDPGGGDPGRLARGVVDSAGLTVYVLVEPFANGADVYVWARFTEDRPHEVALAAFRRDGSAELSVLTLSATMGNYARLRRLHLADRVASPDELWPGFTGDGFTGHARFGLDALRRDDRGAVIVTATGDETAPERAGYADGTAAHWRYDGRTAIQGWRVEDPAADLEVLVNARACYWASRSPIPGGASFENFELGEPFRPGREYVFTVEPA